nr:hypothetical protein CFP56_11211 [Quercus suber]
MPTYQVLSDRRGDDRTNTCSIRSFADLKTLGGRTAWSCTVGVGGQSIPARYWYDGQYINNAKEDAAERALQVLGQLRAPPGPQPSHYQDQQRAVQDPGTGPVGS